MSIDARPPVFRFAAWLGHRKTLCSFCRKEPRVMLDGTDRYCSLECMEHDALDQAIA